jgi:peptide subunit release factor RF-3
MINYWLIKRHEDGKLWNGETFAEKKAMYFDGLKEAMEELRYIKQKEDLGFIKFRKENLEEMIEDGVVCERQNIL